ncbi:hypothetical protein BD410DRAFT_847124, partial [Rickenella mellea]
MPDVEREDDAHILRDFAGAVAQQNAAQRKMARYATRRGEISETYPIGKNPTWDELKAAIKSRPLCIIRGWDWDNRFEAHAGAAQLFVKMSQAFWGLAFEKKHFFSNREVYITCLEDAMRSWSVESITNFINEPHFLASNATYSGSSKRGKQDVPFEKLRDRLYFCSPSTKTKESSKWRTLVERGYLHEYHEFVRTHTPEDVSGLQIALDTIFMGIQCLPSSTDTNIWLTSKETNGPIFRTNTGYYKIDGLRRDPPSKNSTNPLPRVEVSNKQFADALEAQDRGVEFVRARRDRQKAAARNKRRSGKSKRARKPPPNRGRKKRAVTPDDVNNSGSSTSDGDDEDDDAPPKRTPTRRRNRRSKATPTSDDYVSDSEPEEDDNPSPTKRRRMASMRKSTQEATQNRGKTQYTGRITRARAEANRPEVPVPTMPPSAMIRPERSQPCRTAKGNRRRLRSLSIEFDIHDPKATQLQLQNDASGDDGGRTSDTSLMSASQLPPKPVLRMPPHTSTSINTHNTMTLDDNGQSSDASMISMSIEPLIASHSVHTSYRVTGLESSDSESGEEEDGSSEPGYTDDDEPEPGQNVM